MTQEDQARYDALSVEDKVSYDFYSKRHPEWEVHQIMSMIGLEEIFNDGINDGGTDGGDAPEPQKTILERLDNWFLRNYPDLHVKVSPIIQKAIDKLTQLIITGVKMVKNIYETLKELFT